MRLWLGLGWCSVCVGLGALHAELQLVELAHGGVNVAAVLAEHFADDLRRSWCARYALYQVNASNLLVHVGKEALQSGKCRGMTDRSGEALGERVTPPNRRVCYSHAFAGAIRAAVRVAVVFCKVQMPLSTQGAWRSH